MTIFTRVSAMTGTFLGHCSARSDFLRSSSRSLCDLSRGTQLTGNHKIMVIGIEPDLVQILRASPQQ
jgi:hypothetical protein